MEVGDREGMVVGGPVGARADPPAFCRWLAPHSRNNSVGAVVGVVGDPFDTLEAAENYKTSLEFSKIFLIWCSLWFEGEE